MLLYGFCLLIFFPSTGLLIRSISVSETAPLPLVCAAPFLSVLEDFASPAMLLLSLFALTNAAGIPSHTSASFHRRCAILQQFLHRHRHRQHHQSLSSSTTEFELVASHDLPLTQESASAPAQALANGQSHGVSDFPRENRRQSGGQRNSADSYRKSTDSQRPPTSQRRMNKGVPVSIFSCNLCTVSCALEVPVAK